jgi:hypothetical protein
MDGDRALVREGARSHTHTHTRYGLCWLTAPPLQRCSLSRSNTHTRGAAHDGPCGEKRQDSFCFFLQSLSLLSCVHSPPAPDQLVRVVQLLHHPLQPLLGQGGLRAERVDVARHRVEGGVGVAIGRLARERVVPAVLGDPGVGSGADGGDSGDAFRGARLQGDGRADGGDDGGLGESFVWVRGG